MNWELPITGVILITNNSSTPEIVRRQVMKNTCSSIETKAVNDSIEVKFVLNTVLDLSFFLENYRRYSINKDLSLTMRIAGKVIDLKMLK